MLVPSTCTGTNCGRTFCLCENFEIASDRARDYRNERQSGAGTVGRKVGDPQIRLEAWAAAL